MVYLKKMIQSLFQKIGRDDAKKLAAIEKRIAALEKKCSAPVSEDTHIHIDSLHVDKIDYHVEFGELSIDQLQGRLNIGATYYMPKKEKQKKPKPKTKESSSPIVSIRSKPE
ncbi:hypothetical protein [Bacillus sp. NPDC077027]|uniref:hypothetical protein n=1 Tax=Bacillus sp. NPDC077027 TaxID=3390548 RepID=UPI003D022964